jgi:hypothetical protein
MNQELVVYSYEQRTEATFKGGHDSWRVVEPMMMMMMMMMSLVLRPEEATRPKSLTASLWWWWWHVICFTQPLLCQPRHFRTANTWRQNSNRSKQVPLRCYWIWRSVAS